ncbi:nucleoid-associated protein YejK [Rheinheimera sp. WS51]|uniref:nucleoid-associated protein YejK n=1 Tax=Rheinheimera sp. WS51 TaxID=3425886 RepID=UPI003D8A5F68
MSIEVKQLAINHIELDDQAQSKAHYRASLVEPTIAVSHLIEQLHLAYNGKPAKGYAVFNAENPQQVVTALNDWLQQTSDFTLLANAATAELEQQLMTHKLPEHGYFLICHYRYLASDYLLFCLLGSKDHFALSDELELATSRHLDIARMQLAARIDLTAYQTSAQSGNYLSFIRGRAGRKVADFFLDFLGCEEGADAKANSKVVLASVEEYFSAAEFDEAEKNDTRKQVYAYCEERAKSGQEVVLSELSAVVDEQEQQGFMRYCQEQQLTVEEKFPVEVKELKNLVKFAGQGGGVSLSFEQKLLGDRVQYDAHSDTLLIKGTPPNLRDQLQRFVQGYSSFEHKTKDE